MLLGPIRHDEIERKKRAEWTEQWVGDVQGTILLRMKNEKTQKEKQSKT